METNRAKALARWRGLEEKTQRAIAQKLVTRMSFEMISASSNMIERMYNENKDPDIL